ncbi:hypothetical protein V5799_004833 [Amblyomma americanum]|uniref:Uncharacterized protein n=1 Tax=Amblyomma americanum TaxID=6943 RepID=A0AAQ4D4Z4_AMBAM
MPGLSSNQDLSFVEPTDANVAILFDWGTGARPQAVSCQIPAEAPYIRICGQPVCRSRFSRNQLSRLFWTSQSKSVALQKEPSVHRGSHGLEVSFCNLGVLARTACVLSLLDLCCFSCQFFQPPWLHCRLTGVLRWGPAHLVSRRGAEC